MVTPKSSDVTNGLNTPVRAEITNAVGKSGKTAREACTVAMIWEAATDASFLAIGILGGTFGRWPTPTYQHVKTEFEVVLIILWQNEY